LYPRPWNSPSSCSFSSSDDREGAPISHAYTSHYGDPHSEEGDHPASTCVPSSSSDDHLSLVKHDARVDLNPGGVRIRYTQEPAFMSDSPLSCPLPYIVSGQRVGVGCSKVLIPNPKCKGKGCPESASSNLTPRVQRCHPPPKICGPPRMMEFTDDDMEEEKE
jgi:hypothetical protein